MTTAGQLCDDYPPIARPLPAAPDPPTPEPRRKRGLRWRLYYQDATVLGSHQSGWNDARRDGVVAVVWQADDQPVQVELGTPYYLHCHDWIARCWDPTLYLRKGPVKFGRWARAEVFRGAWLACVRHAAKDASEISADHQALEGSVVAATREHRAGEPLHEWRIFYDDGSLVVGRTADDWRAAPSDGVLAVTYHHVLNDVRVSFAVRRFTYYFWKGSELINTDDLRTVVEQYPEYKFGQPGFTGASYLDQGRAIAAALQDTLEDIP